MSKRSEDPGRWQVFNIISGHNCEAGVAPYAQFIKSTIAYTSKIKPKNPIPLFKKIEHILELLRGPT